MAPTYTNGEIVIARPYNRLFTKIQRLQVVAFHPPLEKIGWLKPGQETVFMFRVVGLPGERVEARANGIFINGKLLGDPKEFSFEVPSQSWTLGPREFFVVGDNRSDAYDSRFWGPLHETNIVAIVKPRKR